jgi:hypothetical protein
VPDGFPGSSWKNDPHSCPAAFGARDVDLSTVCLDKFVTNRKPKSGSGCLGREKRIEYSVNRIGAYTFAGVIKFHADFG